MKGYVFGLLYMESWAWYEECLPATAKLIHDHGGSSAMQKNNIANRLNLPK